MSRISNPSPEDIYKLIELVYPKIQNHVRTTPLIKSDYFSDSKNNVYLKLENLQQTGSFKFRGALSKISSLSYEQLDEGIITASTGNHGRGVAKSLELLGGKGTIYLPKNASQSKVDKLSKFSVELKYYGQDSGDTEVYAKVQAEKHQLEYISPYNDKMIIAGQGTIGKEIHDQLDQIDNIFVTVGGGGLISGIASYLKEFNTDLKVYGCQPSNSPVMYESIKAGKIISYPSKDTLSDGSAGGIEKNAITFDLCKELIDRFILVDEGEIKEAIVNIFQNEKLIIEGAAAVAVAAYLKNQSNITGNSVIVLCGGNIDMSIFKEITC